ncbi:MAG TPA: HWE histidine kinase domain-containing protein [Azospirillaceae bacterium]|nr:HWE histidine kinase domain-containing protein [Azospirillaceae bacterium]
MHQDQPTTRGRRTARRARLRLPGAVRGRLLLLSLCLLVPAVCLAGLLIADTYGTARRQAEAQLLATTRALALALDRQLGTYEAILRTLATSPHLRTGDYGAFHAQAAGLRLDGAWVVMARPDGQQLVNLRVPYGTPLPRLPYTPEQLAALEMDRFYTCDLFDGPVAGEPVLCLAVPARAGERRYDLGLGFTPKVLNRLLEDQRLPPGWYGSVLDSSGTVVARNIDPGRFVGRRATPDVLAGLERQGEGVHESVSLEGTETVAGYSRSPVYGWSVVVAAPRAAVFAAPWDAVRVGLAASLVLLAGGGVLSWRVAASIRRPVMALAGQARRAAQGLSVEALATGLAEVDATAATLAAAAAEARTRDRQLRLVADSVPILIAHVGPDLRYSFVNRAYEAWHRRTVEETIGRTVEEVLGPRAFDMARPNVALALAGREVTYETWMPFADGQRRYVRITYIPHRDEDGTAAGFFVTTSDLTGRRVAEERQALLAREVDHRAKNLLAVVQSIIRLTRAPTQEDFVAALDGRLTALARVHTLLATNHWDGADLRLVVEQELAPFAASGRVAADGPDLALRPDAVQPLAMSLHELATNAAKYGALSGPDGRVSVSWRLREEDGRLELWWTEEGGPAVAAPTRTGFGSAVLDTSVRHQLNGEVALDWRPAGLRVRVTVPADQIARHAPGTTAKAPVGEPA